MSRALLPLVLIFGSLACEKGQNREYCDPGHPCIDAELPYCDLDGHYPASQGLSHRCIATPQIPCGDAGTVCPGDLPVCQAGICAGCMTSTDCTSMAQPTCSPTGQCMLCTLETDCALHAAAPHCRNDGSCVACRDRGDCTVDQPICAATTGTCRTCQADSDCPELCDRQTGRCLAPADVLYVDASAAGDCSQATPCKTIGEAVARVTALRRHIKVAAGTYGESVTLNKLNAVIAGAGPATAIVPTLQAGKPGFLVQGDSIVFLRNLLVRNASGTITSSASGVRCEGSGPTTQLTVERVHLESNGAQGLYASSCAVTLRQSFVSQNQGGGVKLLDSDYTLENDIIVTNGGGTAGFGGVQIQNDPPSGAAASSFRFNTVALNTSLAPPSGVSCALQTTPLAAADTIVWNNNSGVGAQVGGCTWTFSDIGPVAEGANLFSDPKLTSDYHLGTGSPCIDAADPAATLGVDYDGSHRPARTGYDIGALEAQ